MIPITASLKKSLQFVLHTTVIKKIRMWTNGTNGSEWVQKWARIVQCCFKISISYNLVELLGRVIKISATSRILQSCITHKQLYYGSGTGINYMDIVRKLLIHSLLTCATMFSLDIYSSYWTVGVGVIYSPSLVMIMCRKERERGKVSERERDDDDDGVHFPLK